MSFIGILTENKNEEYLKKCLLSENLGEIFFLSEKTIDNMRNIKFETFLLGKDIENNQENIRFIAKKADYIIINSDIKENLAIIDNLDLTVITYGYNQKATITISSIEENKRMICLQRSIRNIYGEEVEPQEIEIKASNNESDYSIMELASLSLLYKKAEC